LKWVRTGLGMVVVDQIKGRGKSENKKLEKRGG